MCTAGILNKAKALLWWSIAVQAPGGCGCLRPVLTIAASSEDSEGVFPAFKIVLVTESSIV